MFFFVDESRFNLHFRSLRVGKRAFIVVLKIKKNVNKIVADIKF